MNKIASNSENGIPIMVEGKKDKLSLRRLKVRGKIVCIKSARGSLLDFLSMMNTYNEVLVLTDFDREGEELAKFIEKELASMKIKSNFSLWKELKGLASHDLNAMEGLAGYIEKLRLKVKNERI